MEALPLCCANLLTQLIWNQNTKKFKGIICQSPAGAGVNDYTWNEPVIE